MWPWYARDLYRDTPAWLDSQAPGAQAAAGCGLDQGLLFPVRYLAEQARAAGGYSALHLV
ncbi:unnamed protein product [Prorocentrum cordatum]|uniref:Uncharacterized protein n=1 Tax=Prorocentrum cordatum TaxID=2364126 RepID=A0ABN9PY88_9DINO|nr:unnamed protein product [Polarella glacialis]